MATKTYRDGRVKLKGRNYAAAKRQKWEAQGRNCAICGLYVPIAQADADHIKARGLGGGSRDDRQENLQIVHRTCHFNRHYRERDRAVKT